MPGLASLLGSCRLAWFVIPIGLASSLYADEKARSAQNALTIENSLKMKLVLVPAGEFLMGEAVPKYQGSNTAPQHRVRITRPFYLGAHEVTVSQFEAFVTATGYKPDAGSSKRGGITLASDGASWQWARGATWRKNGISDKDDQPVINVSWNDAAAFCAWLSRKEGATYRLPTEAEWEYACKAGSTTKFCSGDDPEGLAKVANIADKSYAQVYPPEIPNVMPGTSIAADDTFVFTSPVGSFQPNAFGIYDMHGNVSEHCADWMGDSYYKKSPLDDPQGPQSGQERVARGGAWNDGPYFCESTTRFSHPPSYAHQSTGFRVARNGRPVDEE